MPGTHGPCAVMDHKRALLLFLANQRLCFWAGRYSDRASTFWSLTENIYNCLVCHDQPTIPYEREREGVPYSTSMTGLNYSTPKEWVTLAWVITMLCNDVLSIS